MAENCPVNDCQRRLLIAAIEEIVKCNDNFRAGMPEEWEGDPLQDAVDSARFLLIRLGADVGDVPVREPK